MKILITHELFPPDFAGGGEKLVYEMAKHLQEAGHQIKVLTTGNPQLKEFEGLPTLRLPINRYLMNFALLPILREARQADIIQTSTYNACFPSWLAGKILGKPVCCLIMGYWGKQWSEMRKGLKGILSRFIEKLQTHRSYHKVIFLSDFSRNFALSSGFPKKNTIIINPGVNVKNYQPLKKENFILFSGRFAKQKGVYDVLKVAKLLPHLKFVMMGWGEEEEKLKKIAPPNLEFSRLTSSSGPSFFEMYGKAPIFFLPSYGETFGFVLVEAMASGCAIVSTIPLGYEGITTKTGDIDKMAKAIGRLIKDQKLINQIGEKNIFLAKNFSWDTFTNKLIKEYYYLLNKNKAPTKEK